MSGLIDTVNNAVRFGWARDAAVSARGNTAGSRTQPMTTDPTTGHDDAAILELLHHVIFEMTPEQAAALMADDEPLTAAAHPRTAFHGHDTYFLDKSL
jgi:hypothetical protein